MSGLRAAVREVLAPDAFFEALGVRYVGPIEGHDVGALEEVLRLAGQFDEPIIVHVVTQKGRGYQPAEDDDEKCLHDAPVFDPAIGPPRWIPVGYTQAFADAIVEAGDIDPRVVAITAAMAGPTGLIPFQNRHPDRFVDVGIAEQHAVTAAAGHGHGRAAAGGGHLLHLPQPGLRPDQPRRRPPPPAGGLRRRPGRDHRRRRPVPPRHPRHGPAEQGAGDDHLRPLVGPGAGGHAQGGAVDRRRSLGGALPQGPRPPGAARRGRLGTVGPPRAPGPRRVHPGRGQAGGGGRGRGPPAPPAGDRLHRVGRAGGQAPRPRHDRRRRRRPPRGHRRGRGPGGRGRLGHRRRHRPGAAAGGRCRPPG